MQSTLSRRRFFLYAALFTGAVVLLAKGVSAPDGRISNHRARFSTWGQADLQFKDLDLPYIALGS